MCVCSFIAKIACAQSAIGVRSILLFFATYFEHKLLTLDKVGWVHRSLTLVSGVCHHKMGIGSTDLGSAINLH